MLARTKKAQDGTNRTATASEAARDRQSSVGALDQSAGSVLGTAIGAQIRILRRAVDMTAGELAERAGVSGSMLSKIERGLASPSVATLAALASALKIPVARFFTSYDERRDCSFVRAGKGLTVERRGTKCGHQYELLGHSLSGELFVEPYLVTLTEEATPYPSFQHTGIEFLYVLSGEMRYRYADRIYELRTGDALLFDATALHGPEALQRRPVVYLSVDFNLRA